MSPNFLSRLVKGKSKEEEKVVRSKGLEASIHEELHQIAGDLYNVLEAHNMRVSAFKVNEAPYIISDAAPRERLIQVYSTNDPWLKDVLVDGVSQKNSEHPAWFALTSVRVAVGKVSKNWKEQFAAREFKYSDVTSVSGDKAGALKIDTTTGKIEVVFSQDVGQDVLAAFQKLIEDRRRGGHQKRD